MEDGTVKHEPTTPVYANPYEATLYGNPYDNTSPIGIPPAPPRLKPKVRWKKIILVSFLLLLIPSSIGAGYIIGNTQWQSGYNQGRSAGYTQGNKNGYNSGYSSGKAAGEADASTAYHNGYTQGNSDC